jgi:subtilisin family serine protease
MRTITSLFLLLGFTLLAEAQQSVRYVVELQSPPVFSSLNHRTSSAAVLPSAALRNTRSAGASNLAAETDLPVGARLAAAEQVRLPATAGEAQGAATAGLPTPQEQAAALELIQQEQAKFDTHAAASGFKSIRHLAHAINSVVVEGRPGSEAALRALPGVKRVARERIYRPQFDASIALHEIDSAWAAIPGATYNPANPTAWNVAGNGVKIGIIDTGIDVTHPAFIAPNMTAPPGFPHYNTGGIEGEIANNQSLTSGKIIVARSYGGQLAQDVDGHGTAVAQLAAGVPIASGIYTGTNGTLASPNNMTLSGVAPAAWLGIYDVDSQLNGSYSDSDILSALDDCATDGMNIVSMSFGAPDYGGSADPLNQEYNDTFSVLIGMGTVLIASAGNDGPDAYTIAAPAVDPGIIATGAQQSPTLLGDTNITASNITTPIEAAAADNNADIIPALTAPLVTVTTWDTTGLGCDNGGAWPQTNVAAGKILIVQRGTCTFVEKVQNAQTAGAVALIVYNESAPSDGSDPDSLVTMELDSATTPSSLANFPAIFVGYDDGETLLSDLSSGGSSYAVTAQFGLVTGDPHHIADFSARGPDADLALKPELVAAGNSVVTAYCTVTTLYPEDNMCDVFGYLFWDGTSFSAPLTAGAAAVIMSARPNLTSDDYRSLVVNTASPMLDPAGNTWPVQSAGAGSLDLLRGIQSTVSINPITLSFGTTGSGIATTQQITLKNVGASTTTYNLTFEGMSDLLPTVPTVPVTVSWGTGSFTVFFPAFSFNGSSYSSQLPVTPTLSVDSVTLAPRATANVTVSVPAGLAPGAYQGFIDVTASGGSIPQARLPYWYAVPGTAPTQMSFDVSPLYISAGDTESMIMRFIDSNGVLYPAPGTITVTETSTPPAWGPATFDLPYQASSDDVVFPNVWLVDITIPYADPGGTTYTFQVSSGTVTGTFTVISEPNDYYPE